MSSQPSDTLMPTGFSGEVAVDALTELVQLLCAAGTSGVLRVDHGEERGSIGFERGAIVDAEIGDVHGVAPFQRMLKWSGGVFALDRGARAAERSIQIPTMQLLLEAVRLLDEQNAPVKQVRGSEVRLRAVGRAAGSAPALRGGAAGSAPALRGGAAGSAPALRGGASSTPPPLPPEARVVRSKSAPPIRSASLPRPPGPSRPPELVRLPVPPEPAGLVERWTTPEQRAAECFERGMQLAQDKRYDQALREWERAAELVPDNRTYQFNIRRLRELAERRRETRGTNGDEE